MSEHPINLLDLDSGEPKIYMVMMEERDDMKGKRCMCGCGAKEFRMYQVEVSYRRGLIT